MEHSCYQCGTAVEEGIAFCPQCRAPQIRVTVAVPQAVLASEAGFGEVVSQGSVPAAAIPPAKIDWQQALPAAALAGSLAALLMIIPLGASFGLGMLSAGFLCVLFYRRRVPHANPTPWVGARLGMVSGALGFVLFGLLTLIETTLFHAGNDFRLALLQAVEQAAARNSDPQAQQMFQYLKTPQGLLVVMIMALAATFFVFLIFASLGGAVGAAILRRKNRA